MLIVSLVARCEPGSDKKPTFPAGFSMELGGFEPPTSWVRCSGERSQPFARVRRTQRFAALSLRGCERERTRTKPSVAIVATRGQTRGQPCPLPLNGSMV